MALFALAIVAFAAMMFLLPKARADGVYGVRETATEVLVDVPRFCRPLKVVWEVQWEQKTNDEDALDAILASMQKEKGAKVTSHYLRRDALKLSAIWQGGRTIHIPKFDAKGKPIKIEQLSILALGGGDKLMNEKNWALVAVDSKVMVTSPPVNVGTWGKCS